MCLKPVEKILNYLNKTLFQEKRNLCIFKRKSYINQTKNQKSNYFSSQSYINSLNGLNLKIASD